MECKVIDLELKLDKFDEFRRSELAEYVGAVADGTCQTTRSEFDRYMLLEQRELTTALISAEAERRDAKLRLVELGLRQEYGREQRSQFCDDVNDGYRLSFECDIVDLVDHARIEAWMDDETSILDGDVDCDLWDFKPVELSDSISLIAEDPDERRWIARWKALTENMTY